MTDFILRLHEYLISLEPDNEPLLKELTKYAQENHVPIVRRETESLLRTICVLKNPKSILEIGSGFGYSTICMGFSAPKAKITTIESYDKRIPKLYENLRRAGIEQRTRCIHLDAGSALNELKGEKSYYDLIFLDAAKGQYLGWLSSILKLMQQGSVLIADNVMQDFTVLESAFLLPHRARSTHKRMREFLFRIKHEESLVSCVLPVGDGVSLSVKK